MADDVKESDRREIERTMYKEVLEVDKHPRITFTSSEVVGAAPGAGSFRATITGTLDLHGVSHPEQIDAQVNVMGERLTANGRCTVRQSDYQVGPVSIAGGALKLKDEVELSSTSWRGRNRAAEESEPCVWRFPDRSSSCTTRGPTWPPWTSAV